MIEEPKEELMKGANELLNRPDREIMALSLGKNDRWSENYLTAMTIKLRSSLEKLNANIEKFDNSSRKTSNVLIFLTVVLVILTILIAYLTYIMAITS